MRDEVGAGDEVDVICSLFFKGKHGIRKFGNRIRAAGKSKRRRGAEILFAQSAGDLVVLAEDTSEIAAGKKDRAGTGSAGDAGFFPHVKSDS